MNTHPALVRITGFTGRNEDPTSSFLVSLSARRAGTPQEIARAIDHPASDKARSLEGPCPTVDGGFTAQ